MLTKNHLYFIATIISALILFAGCEKQEEPEIYQFNITPVKINYSDEITNIRTESFSKDKIGFKIDSYRQKANTLYFEELDKANCSLFCDKDIQYNNKTIEAGKDLLQHLIPIASLERKIINKEASNEDYYSIKIRSTNNNKFTMPSGEYTFYFEGKTRRGRLVKDDVIIKYYEQ